MKVLILNHTHKECGVYQMGKRVYEIASMSNRIDYVYREVNSLAEYRTAVGEEIPDGILYNWHWDRWPWLNQFEITCRGSLLHYFIYHDGSVFPKYSKYLFFGGLDPYKRAIPESDRILLPRPLFEYNGKYPKNKLPTIGSFGFAFLHKRFPELVSLVNQNYNEAVINLHMTTPFFGDTPGNRTSDIVDACRRANRKKGIILNIDTKFRNDDETLSMLARNDINIFFYSDNNNNPGLSSAMDYALSVKRPIALSDYIMFRHVTTPQIVVPNNSIPDVVRLGTKPVEHLYKDWSRETLSRKLDDAFEGK